jgi:signal transduction histidine kinase
VIALGRLMLAGLFLLALCLEIGRPDQVPAETLILATAYLFFSTALLLATWNDWWADARLAGAAHTLDIAMFTLMVLLTQGYTSPFFTFFMFLLLSAAIRWGWRATALTAILVSLLYLAAGMLVGNAHQQFDLQHFVIRTGHLVILSLILIWFGMNQWRSRSIPGAGELLIGDTGSGPPAEPSLRAAMNALHASAGAFVWRDGPDGRPAALTIRDGLVEASAMDQQALADAGRAAPFLYDLRTNRGLLRDSEHNLQSVTPRSLISAPAAAALMLGEGLAIPIGSDSGEGTLFLEGVRNLSTDHLDVAQQIGAEVAAGMQREALLRAAEEGAASRSRLALARDLHDSVVQFLAGAAFRLEAMRRSAAGGTDVADDLDELKQLMLHEQGELRAFVAALRSGSQIALDDLAKDLGVLADRLSKQWSIDCAFDSDASAGMVPARLHLDAQQLVREAVANAVRHAGAKSVSIRLGTAGDELRLDFINDGAAYPRTKQGGRMPQSLQERVTEAGGALDLSRGMGVTKLSITLPLAGSRR